MSAAGEIERAGASHDAGRDDRAIRALRGAAGRGALGLVQALVAAALIFLFLLALRNLFKIK